MIEIFSTSKGVLYHPRGTMLQIAYISEFFDFIYRWHNYENIYRDFPFYETVLEQIFLDIRSCIFGRIKTVF